MNESRSCENVVVVWVWTFGLGGGGTCYIVRLSSYNPGFNTRIKNRDFLERSSPLELVRPSFRKDACNCNLSSDR